MSPSVFDLDHYARLNSAREAFLRAKLPELQRSLGLASAADIGCGVGYFSALLDEMGFRTAAVDGRSENVEEARRRYPQIPFQVMNVEDEGVLNLGAADLVLCFGLLYHLENPFRGVRHLHALTEKLLIVDSMCLPGNVPSLSLRDECDGEDQGLRHIAFYPSEACLVKMLYRAGFPWVYRFHPLPELDLYRETVSARQSRTTLAASKVAIGLPFLVLLPEPATEPDPWKTTWAKSTEPVRRMVRFLRKPWPEKWVVPGKRVG